MWVYHAVIIVPVTNAFLAQLPRGEEMSSVYLWSLKIGY